MPQFPGSEIRPLRRWGHPLGSRLGIMLRSLRRSPPPEQARSTRQPCRSPHQRLWAASSGSRLHPGPTRSSLRRPERWRCSVATLCLRVSRPMPPDRAVLARLIWQKSVHLPLKRILVLVPLAVAVVVELEAGGGGVVRGLLSTRQHRSLLAPQPCPSWPSAAGA